MNVLLIEDDDSIAQPLITYLNEHGCKVAHVKRLGDINHTGATDVVLLDWMLQDGDGVDWLQQFRMQQPRIPVILLTARTEVADKVLALEQGANDYVTKPFAPRELYARMRTHVRTSTTGLAHAPAPLASSAIVLDLQTLDVTYKGTPVELSRTEFNLLKYFLENPKRALSRDTLLNDVWGMRYPSTRTVDVHVMQLRHKLSPELFETLHGMGYRFMPQ